jgi:hypothetical protein
MSTSTRGFASLSAARKKDVAAKGGRKAHADGKAHRFNSLEAKSAALRAASNRKANAVKKAALELLKHGFTPQELADLQLSADQYIFYAKPANRTKLRSVLNDELMDVLRLTTSSAK